MSQNNNYTSDNGRVLRRRTPVVQTATAPPQQQQRQTIQPTASAETTPDSFTRSDIVGDGNCLFRAVSLHLYGHQNHHERLREAALRYIQQNWSELNTFSLIGDDDMKDFNNYYNYMRKNGTYGTSLEILALSETQNSNFHIFSKQRRTRDTKITFRDKPTIISTRKHTETIYLLLTGNPMSGHFELLTPQNTKNIPNNSRPIKEASGERRNGRGRRGKWQLDQNDEDRATDNGPAKSVVPASKPTPTKAGKSRQRMSYTTGTNEHTMRCFDKSTSPDKETTEKGITRRLDPPPSIPNATDEVFNQKLPQRQRNPNSTKPKFKRQIRIENQINNIRRYLGHLTQFINGNVSKRVTQSINKIKSGSPNRTLPEILDTLKQKLSVYAARLRRYKEPNERKDTNNLFRRSQTQFYRKTMHSKQTAVTEPPNKQELTDHWKSIWSEPKLPNNNTPWIKAKEGKDKHVTEQENSTLTTVGPKSMMRRLDARSSGGRMAPRSDLRVGAGSEASTCRHHNFKIDFCNIRGINSNINSVHQHLQSDKPHVLALCETKVSPSTSTVNYLYPGYDFYSRFRRNFGICLFVRSDLSCQREEALEPPNFDVMWLKITTQQTTRFICILYRPPSDTNFRTLFASLADTIDHLQSNYPSAEIAILGDFNVHNINWLKYSNTTDEQGREAESFSISYGLTQLIDEPTRIPDRDGEFASLLDLFLTTNPEIYTVTVNPPLGSSDHKLLSTSSILPISDREAPRPRKIWHYKSAKWEDLMEYFRTFPWMDVCFRSDNPSDCAREVSDVILAGMEAYIPFSKKCSSNGKPWFDRKCKEAVASKHIAYRQWRENPNTLNRNIFVHARNRCKGIIDETKEAHNQRIRNKLLACPNNSRSFWAVAKAVSQNFTKSTIPPLTRPDNSIATTPVERANLLAELFASHSTVDFQGKTPPTIPILQSRMPDVVFRQRIIKRILMKLDTKKASGADGIPAIVLKNCARELTPVFCRLFNLSYRKGIFPSCWKCATVQPIPKKGKKTLPNNYRPVALLSIISKVMEKVINEHLLKYLERFNIISDHQYGFRKHRSTGDLLTYVTHVWNNAIEHFGESRAVALDISKAFDRVWHDGLLAKLRSYGMSEKFCLWLSCFLRERSLRVAVDGFLSNTFTINAGVPQGSILSPTLFLIYINDLLEKTENPIYSFADDSTLISSFTLNARTSTTQTNIRRQQEVIQLNKDLEEILSWGDSNQVEFNATKTQAAVFSKKVNVAEPDIVMSGHSIPLTSSLNLLGVNLGANMSWHEHVAGIARRASQKLGILFRTRKLYTPQQLLILYKAQIRPTMEYCSHVWSSAPKHTLHLLDSIQRRAVRLIGHPELTDGLDSLEHRRTVGDLSLFYKYFHGKCSKDVARLIPPRAVHIRSTRCANASHPYEVQLVTPRTTLFKQSFIWRTSYLWNGLPRTVFPIEYNLQRFKNNVNRFLRTRVAPVAL